MSRSRAGSGILGIVAVTAAVIGSARVAHAQAPGAAGPPTSGPPQGGYPPPPPPSGYPPPPPPSGYPPPPPPSGYPPPPPPSGYPPPPPPSGYPPPPPAQPPEPDGIHRSGFIIGFSLGWGSISCSSCPDGDSLSGAAVDIHLGGMLAPNVALMFDGSGIGHTIDGSGTLTHVVDTLAVQVWASGSGSRPASASGGCRCRTTEARRCTRRRVRRGWSPSASSCSRVARRRSMSSYAGPPRRSPMAP